MKGFSYVGLASILLIALCSRARAFTINFDPQTTPPGDLPPSLTAMGNSPGSAVPSDAQLSDQYDADGVLFSSSAPYVAVVDIGSGVASPPNGIGGATSGGLLSYADPVTFTFVLPGTLTAAVTNSISIQADATGIPGQYATLSAFGIDGHLLDQQTLDDVGSEVWNINVVGIHSATFNFPTTSAGVPTTGSAYGNGTGIALDNLEFGTVSTASTGPTAVPLPPALMMAAAALPVAAGAYRLSRRRAGAGGLL